MDTVDITAGLQEDGTIVLNTPRNPQDIDLPFRVVSVDATGIAIDHDIVVGGIPIVNTSILGALPHVIDNLTIEAVEKAIVERWKGDAGETNAAAARAAYDGVKLL